ncbi:hypothetical protein PC116_g4711 [Phytophthora cactorum]|nr:hypothetical protein PC116_g4711 [Phytophthora cactorum]
MRIRYADNMNVFTLKRMTYWRSGERLPSFTHLLTTLPRSGWTAGIGDGKYFTRQAAIARRKSQMVVHDALKRTPAPENHIQQPAPFMARAAASVVGTGRVVVHSTDNPSMCRVKQIEKEDDAESDELSDL